ncbi:MAG: glycosyltransferase family 2 protein [Verrucomicrobiae bacterium]|nr:glycosyltransferase family 2 protein [Verrucomicrobiae bacterium]
MTVQRGYPRHRIVLPVYIPSTDGYYADSFKILQTCLRSLHATTERSMANVTVIDNGCCSVVRGWLLNQVSDGLLDQVIIHATNRGKPDAIFAAGRASYEQFVTFADADVLFLTGWLSAVERIFACFPEAGIVSPFPGNHVRHLHCLATWLRHLHELQFKRVVPPQDMLLFGQSTGNVSRYDELDWQGQWCVERAGVVAVVGAVHFVVTCRKKVIDAIDPRPCLLGLGDGGTKAERELDAVCDRLGMSKLSTPKAYVKHMGNKHEPWMDLELQNLLGHAEKTEKNDVPCPDSAGKPGWPRFIPQVVRPRLSLSLIHI